MENEVVKNEYFRFQKVDEYFKDVSNWDTIRRMTDCQWNEKTQTLTLSLKWI